ncbi:hypothetical protein KC571_03015 [candidate division WWE3 bacterium]|uniref:Uncharacterized protein n=1 Tax=candidate division WWE3 bacterium TaxID=2053526 RepID=A0A955RPK7_UNCKA|nr:hypothetical protein [candidate division WWE3 bacterium]
MFDISSLTFSIPPLSEVIADVEGIVIVGFWIILLLFGVQLVQQVRLLNRFLHTAMYWIWFGLALTYLFIILGVGLWYVVA